MSTTIERLEAALVEAEPECWQVDGISEDVVVNVGAMGKHWVTGGGGNPGEMHLIATAVNALPALLRVAKAAEAWRDCDGSTQILALCDALEALDEVKL